MESSLQEKIFAKNLISAAARRDLSGLRTLLKNVSANVQNNADGFTPLHAVVASADSSVDDDSSHYADDQEISEVVQLLFENGAIWNDLNKNNETPGCVAYRLKLKKTYQAIVDAGIRAELLLSKLDQIDGSDSRSISDGDQDVAMDTAIPTHVSLTSKSSITAETGSSTVKEPENTSVTDLSAAYPPPDDYIDHWGSNDAFLKSALRYTDTTLLDHSSNAVMMDWETEIMTRHAATLLPKPGLKAMNIGHGMGIVDAAIQALEPAEHHIVEAHPAVLAQMRAKGWFQKPGVVIHQGRWQDVLPNLAEQGLVLDAIYYDTFAEDYKDLRDLFQEHVIGLLDQDGRFGFYNGMGADRRVCYDVYTGVVEIDLTEVGFKTEWEDIPVPKVNWKGVRRPYWNVEVYRLPICTFE